MPDPIPFPARRTLPDLAEAIRRVRGLAQSNPGKTARQEAHFGVLRWTVESTGVEQCEWTRDVLRPRMAYDGDLIRSLVPGLVVMSSKADGMTLTIRLRPVDEDDEPQGAA